MTTQDIPSLEMFRHLDPTTAEHYQRNGGPPRYWRDIDENTFKKKLNEITNVTKVNMERPNIMAKYVRYL